MKSEHTILFDARAAVNEYPGMNRYIRSLLTNLVPLLNPDEQLHVILSPEADALPCLLHPRVTTHRVSASFETFKSQYQAYKVAHMVNAEIHHAPYILTPIRVPGKMVLTMHDILPLSHPQYSTLWQRMLWWYMGLRTVRHSRKIIGVSNCAIQMCAQKFGLRIIKRSCVIYPGISTYFTPASEDSVAAFKERHGLPEKFFLYVGSDRPHKNIATLLEAMALMDPTATIPLVIAGFESENSKLRDRVKELELETRVQWLGVIPEEEMPTLYASAHTFLFPSLVESFGFPVLESMACGTPVICSALGVLKEITDGAAKIVHPTDRQEWKRAMGLALGSLEWRETYREKGLRRTDLFRWDACASATLNVYRSLYRKRS